MRATIREFYSSARCALGALVCAASVAVVPVAAQEAWELDPVEQEREAEDAQSHIPNAPNMGGPAPDVGLATGDDGQQESEAAAERYRLDGRRAAGVIVPQSQRNPGAPPQTGGAQQQGQDETPASPSDIYAAPVRDLLSAELEDGDGEVVGRVQEVVLINNRREAGLIVVPAEDGAGQAEGSNQPHVLFVPVDRVSLRGDRVVLDRGLSPQELTQVESLENEAFQLAPESSEPLGRFIDRQAVTVR